MDYPPFNTAKLGEITDQYYFAAQCTSCKHGRRFNITRLREQLGAEFLVADIRKRLKCDRCGSKNIIVSFFNPWQRVGNLHHLFHEPSE